MLTPLVTLVCERELRLPKESALRDLYGEGAIAVLSGNVAEVVVIQPEEQIARGGTLWAHVGPYIYLFSPQTRDLFRRYNGLAAVRVITRSESGEEIARAMLVRDTLSDILWRRSLNIAGRARLEGTQNPNRLYDLVRWGERYAEYRYGDSPR